MKTEKEINDQKQKDLQFIVSAVTSELHEMAYLKYFDTWENQGGMGWFFDECVEITNKIMLTEGSQYLKWLDHWKETEGTNNWESFSEITGETCFDWYHMNEAAKEFKSRYEVDECTFDQVSERIGYFLNEFKNEDDRSHLISLSVDFAFKKREQKREFDEAKAKAAEEAAAKLIVNDPRVQQVIDTLKELEVDGESMEHIIDKVGMTEQMVKQLCNDKK